MAFTLVQSGTALELWDTAGARTTLTLPTGVTLSSTRPPRFAINNRYVVMVNSPSRPLTVDGAGTVRVLTPAPPGAVPVVSTAAGGTLTGTYAGIRQTFLVKDEDGNVIAESGYGPGSGSASPSAQWLKVTGLAISGDTITGSRLYRPTTGGITLFPWLDLDGNTQTSIQDDLADAALSTVAAPSLGAAPDLTTIAEWRGRLWGPARNAVDYLQFSEAGAMYAWPAINSILVPKLGADTRGIIALAARRESLGVGRRNSIHHITGNSLSDFRPVKLSENVGIESQESVVVYRNAAFFLWKDGVYRWDDAGIKCISDGKVRSWFTTDSYFNRARFQNAFACIDPLRNRYKLFLCNAGDSVENRWVEYDLNDQTWWGPHKTDAVTTLTSAFVMPDANDTLLPVIGNSTGFVWKEQAIATDNTSTGIALDVNTKFYDSNTPEIEKYWGELSVLGKVQSAGTLSITPSLGYTNASADTPIAYDMTKGRQRLRRLGNGQVMQLNLTHSTAGEPVELYGFEVANHELGRR